MKRRWELVRAWEDRLKRGQGADYLENLRVFEALYAEARLFGIFPLKHKLEGIENDIELARKINVRAPH